MDRATNQDKQVKRSYSAKHINTVTKTEQLKEFQNKNPNFKAEKLNNKRILSATKCPPLSSNIKTQPNSSSEELMKVYPSEVVFKNIERNQIYEMAIYVQNLSTIPKRIKIIQPKTNRFRVDYDAQGTISAGLSMKIVAIFEATISSNQNMDQDKYTDKLQIIYEKDSKKGIREVIDVPMLALKPRCELEFDTFINFGFIKINRDHQYKFSFQNNGQTTGKVRMAYENLPQLSIDLPMFDIRPNERKQIVLTYKPRDTGVFRNTVQVFIDDQKIAKSIDINGTSVDFNIFMTDNIGTRAEEFKFNELYFGQKKIINGFLVNNTPNTCNFKISMRNKELFKGNIDEGIIQLPSEQGQEMCEQIMKGSPFNGQIKPYQQIPVQFTCQPKVEINNQLSVKKYSMLEKQPANSKVQEGFVQENREYYYTAIIDFDNDEEQLVISLQAIAIHPSIKIDKPIIDFGECPVNDHRETLFNIENTNKFQSIDITIPRVPQFKVHPQNLVLEPFMSASFQAMFVPNNVGKYNKNIEIHLLNGQYKIPIKVKGLTNNVNPKPQKIRGTECLPINFQQSNNYVDENQKILNPKKMTIEDTGSVQNMQIKNIDPDLTEQRREMIEELKMKKENEEKYINQLRQQKESRIVKEKQKILKLRVKEMEDKLKYDNPNTFPQKEDSEDDKNDHTRGVPRDLEWEVKMIETNLEEPFLEFPEQKDNLFVLKPIGIYEPLKDQENKHFHPREDQPAKSYFPERPITHKDVRDVYLELTGEDLQKIIAGPRQIDFGTINIKSKIIKSFTIKNDLRNTIRVQLFTSSPELQETYQKPQIIPSSETAKFNVVMNAINLDENFKQNIKYVINGKHQFEFEVKAKVQQVKVEIDVQQLKFTFTDDNDRMETFENLKLTNNGNAEAKIKWDQDSKAFIVEPREAVIQAKETLQCRVIYRPTTMIDKKDTGSGGPRTENDQLILRVQDGIDQTIRCTGVVNEAKCMIKNTELDLGEILVWKEEVRIFSMQNKSRIPAVFQVVRDNSNAIEVTPLTGRIAADATIDFTVKYSNPHPMEVREDISIMLRGGKIYKLPFIVKTVVPQVEIIQPEFNFGKITTGNRTVLQMALVNYSNITAELQLDMRTEEDNPDCVDGIECLQIIPIDDGDESIMKSINADLNDEGEGNRHRGDTNEDEEPDQIDSGSENDKQDSKTPKQYMIPIGPGQTLKFELKFAPKDVKPYNFDLPLTLFRYGKLPGLTRPIICKGVKPKFLVEPSQVDFHRKIITNVEKMYPITSDIVLSNPEKTEVKWRLDESVLKDDKIFSIHPTKGRVDPGQTLRIKASFNPQTQGIFEKIIPIYIEDPELPPDKPCLELKLKGEAQFPKLLFDRTEIIMPVVPLNIESKCSFMIINEGYDNLALNYKIHEDLGQLNITFNFPDGKNLGMGRAKIIVEACFTSKTPISFSTKINFYDEQSKVYSIPISGTADNCLLTNFPYLQRQKGDFAIEINEKNMITLIEGKQEMDDFSEIGDNNHKKKNPTSVGSVKSMSSKASVKNGLGYSPVPLDFIEYTKESIKIWLNGNVLNNNIQSFPETIIEQNGTQLFELLQFLAGSKNFSQYKAVIEKHVKRQERALLLFNQYDQIIKQLKMEGAFLNHIRPHYLLPYADYVSYMKQIPKEDKQFFLPNALKINYQKFQYLNNDAWIVLFYQILKIYYLQRVTNKILKTIPNNTNEKADKLPVYYLEGSNIYSSFEGILMRWIEVNYEIFYNSKDPIQQQQLLPARRLTNFDSDLQDGHYILALIQNYLAPLTANLKKIISNMKYRCQNEEDCLSNCSRLIQVLEEIKLFTTFNANDIAKPSGREIILFLMQIFNALPNYIPKGQPIIFNCVLGDKITKTIELTNPTANKNISYWVNYDGSPDFVPEFQDCFKIEPKQTFKFKITFESRVSKEQIGRITFTNKKESNVQASAIVFELKSLVTERQSVQKKFCSSALYESTFFEIPVENTFLKSDYGEFNIQIVHEQELPKKKPAVVDDKKKKGKQKKQEDHESIVPFIPSFFCKTANKPLKLKRKQTYSISMCFIPMVYEKQRCYIIFSDQEVGEFMYELEGEVTLPQEIMEIPRIPIQPPIFVDEIRVWTLPLEFKNPNISRGRQEIEKYQVDKRKGSTDKQKIPKQSDHDQKVYDVEVINQTGTAIALPKQIILQNPRSIIKNKEQKNKQSGGNQSIENTEKQENSTITTSIVADTKNLQLEQELQKLNNLQFTFNFKNPIQNYQADIILRTPDKTDIRRFHLRINAQPKPVRALLEMNCPSREFVHQDIPIVNNTERDWHIKITLTGTEENNFSYFSVTHPPTDPLAPLEKPFKDFLIKKKTAGNIPIIFKPDWICQAEAKLVLQNPLTNDVFEYDLKGTGEEPLAEDHIIINCRARQTTTHEITIINPYFEKGVTYNVETDLIGASGAQVMSILPKKKKGVYQLSITPVLSGQYTGSITFTENEGKGKYIWWTVLLDTESPPSSKVLDLNAALRKPIAADIEISNPLMETVNFEVLIEGEGLLGEQYFLVPHQSTQTYELIYMPLKVGKSKGSIAFVSERMGEIWYELNLVCEDSGAIRLPMLKCELGKQEQHEIMLENPSGKEQKIKIINSNTMNFDVFPDIIIIPPYEVCYAHITYMPSILDQAQTADIIFDNDEIGKWHYLCFGMGTPPTQFEPKLVSIDLNKDISSVIYFKNPFKDSINIKIFLEIEDQEAIDVLKLLTKNLKDETKILVSGQATIQIPFTFTPTEIREYKATLIVSMNEKIQWRYPIVGVTESYSAGVLKSFKTKCRQPFEDRIQVHLPGITHLKGPHDTFSFEIKSTQQESKVNVDKSFKIIEEKNYLQYPDDTLNFRIQFNPMKPFKCYTDLIIMRKLGGLWKFKLQLEALPPNEDDIIVISSSLHKTQTISFKLTNRSKKYTPFTARFTAESDAEFSIAPKSGVLEPFGTDGTQFLISFTPVEYGKTRIAQLVIETEDMYWSYAIRGILPKYFPPQIVQSKLDDKLEQNIMEQIDDHQHVNFIAQNIKATRELSPSQQAIKQRNQSPSQIDNKSHINKSYISGKSKMGLQSRVFSAKTANITVNKKQQL